MVLLNRSLLVLVPLLLICIVPLLRKKEPAIRQDEFVVEYEKPESIGSAE